MRDALHHGRGRPRSRRGGRRWPAWGARSGLLDAAVARLQASFGGVEAYPTLHLKAAALLQSLVGNHAFVDGNERGAFASLLFFYDLNGLRVTLSHDEAFDLVIGVVVHEIDVEEAAALLEAGTAPAR